MWSFVSWSRSGTQRHAKEVSNSCTTLKPDTTGFGAKCFTLIRWCRLPILSGSCSKHWIIVNSVFTVSLMYWRDLPTNYHISRYREILHKSCISSVEFWMFFFLVLFCQPAYIKLMISLLFLTREQFLEFIKAIEKPVLYLEGSKGINSMYPQLRGMFYFKIEITWSYSSG